MPEQMGTCMALRMKNVEMTFNSIFAAGSVYSLVIKHFHMTREVYLLKCLHTWYS